MRLFVELWIFIGISICNGLSVSFSGNSEYWKSFKDQICENAV